MNTTASCLSKFAITARWKACLPDHPAPSVRAAGECGPMYLPASECSFRCFPEGIPAGSAAMWAAIGCGTGTSKRAWAGQKSAPVTTSAQPSILGTGVCGDRDNAGSVGVGEVNGDDRGIWLLSMWSIQVPCQRKRTGCFPFSGRSDPLLAGGRRSSQSVILMTTRPSSTHHRIHPH